MVAREVDGLLQRFLGELSKMCAIDIHTICYVPEFEVHFRERKRLAYEEIMIYNSLWNYPK